MPAPLELEVHLFASLREAVGRDRIRVTLDPGARAGDVLERLARDYPAVGASRRALAIAVDHEVVGPERLLHAGDEVALIPPVGGG